MLLHERRKAIPIPLIKLQLYKKVIIVPNQNDLKNMATFGPGKVDLLDVEMRASLLDRGCGSPGGRYPISLPIQQLSLNLKQDLIGLGTSGGIHNQSSTLRR